MDKSQVNAAEQIRPEYRKPQVKDYGDLRELTRGGSAGPQTDVPIFSPVAFTQA